MGTQVGGATSEVNAGNDCQAFMSSLASQSAPLFRQLSIQASEGASGVTAITDGRVSLTYPEFVDLCNAFAKELSEAGIKRGDAVGVALRNGNEFAITAFACWKLGALLIPFNPQLQANEVLCHVVDTGVRALVSSARDGQVAQIAEHVQHHWDFPSVERGWIYARSVLVTPSAACGRSSDVQLELPAVTSFSTGSTGRPKRVTRSQAQFAGEQWALSAALNITREDRLLAVTPFFHIYGLVYSLILPLLSGCTVFAVDSFLPAETAALIEREKITGVAAVPFIYELLAKRSKANDFSTIRYALSSGAPLSLDTSLAFERSYGIRIRQAYGSTETGAISIVAEDTPIENFRSVGLPIPGIVIRIIDDNGRQVPIGDEGYVQVSSPFAARGYDSDPGSDESRFDVNGFFPGDVGRLSAFGELTLARRHRGFINVGGSKVDPTEVESVLLELPIVREVVVFGVSDGAAGERIHAVLVTSGPIDREDIRKHCRGRLSAFKNPHVIEFRKELPRSPLGKVLRQQLVDEVGSRSRSSIE